MTTVLDFNLETRRDASAQYLIGEGISAARFGKQSGNRYIEDNGVGVSSVSVTSLVSAGKKLKALFDAVRNLPSIDNDQAAATAAVAVTTIEGVAWRAAGDAPVVAIGDNGKVIVLNKFHTADGEIVTNTLWPGHQGLSDEHEAGSASWKDLERKLGTGNIRISVMSDGISKSHSPEEVARDIEHLIKVNRIDYDNPYFAGRLMDASTNKSYYAYKSDDRIVVSVKRPSTIAEQSMIGAFDGVGSGGTESARVAHAAVMASKDEFVATKPRNRLDLDDTLEKERVQVIAQGPLPNGHNDIHQNLDVSPISRHKWLPTFSPKHGAVLRVDASNMTGYERDRLIKQLEGCGIKAKVVTSKIYGQDYVQVPQSDYGKILGYGQSQQSQQETAPAITAIDPLQSASSATVEVKPEFPLFPSKPSGASRSASLRALPLAIEPQPQKISQVTAQVSTEAAANPHILRARQRSSIIKPTIG